MNTYTDLHIGYRNAPHCKKSPGENAGERSFTFPAPATDLLGHGAAASRGHPGLWAYASKVAVVVVKASSDPARNWPLFTMLDASDYDSYCSVSFCQSEPCQCPIPDSPLVGATEGGLVRIFNIVTQEIVQLHDSHLGHRTIAEWSPRNARLIFGVDNIGRLSVWDVVDNSVVLLSFGHFEVSCLAVSPLEDDIVALGDKAGSVRIVTTVGDGSMLSEVNYADEIYSLSWKPPGSWAVDLQSETDLVLAVTYTSDKPPSVLIVDRDLSDLVNLTTAEPPSLLALPVRSVPALWIEHPDLTEAKSRVELVSIGKESEIVVWRDNGALSTVLHELNSRCNVFGLIQSGDMLWSFSSEPFIVGWNLTNAKIEAVIPTYSGICSISDSGVENTRVALGGVDSYIRILKIYTDYPNGRKPELPLMSTKLTGKVTAVAFHPWLDKVGFGTDSGILGVHEFKGESRHVMEFTKRCGGTIYTVDWGPKCYSLDYLPKKEHESDGKGKVSQSLWLYACGNRNAYGIHPGRPENALVSIGRIIGSTNKRDEDRIYSVITDIKWAPDHVYLAVGYNDGRIEIYLAPHLKLRCWIKCHSNAIQYLAWRGLDFVGEPLKHKYFATAANDGTAKIHDLAQIYDPDFLGNEDPTVVELIRSTVILNGHHGVRVIQVVWSPHEDYHVLTVSYDTTAVLWDLRDCSRIARYMGHEHRLVACGFHPTNPHSIFTASDEMVTNPCFHMWDYRQHPEIDNVLEKCARLSINAER